MVHAIVDMRTGAVTDAMLRKRFKVGARGGVTGNDGVDLLIFDAFAIEQREHENDTEN